MYEAQLFDTNKFTLPCFFIDNSLNDAETFEYSSEEEKCAFLETIYGIKNWLSELPPFECKDMQKVELERQRLEREKQESEIERKKAEELKEIAESKR